MKQRTRWILTAVACVTLAGTIYGCAALKGIPSALANLKKLQFKLDNVNQFRLAGVDISRFASRGDIGFGDVANLTAAVLQKRLPAQFTLNVAVRNPNDAAGGQQSTSTNLFLRKIAWTLHIDDKPTISGVTDQRLQIPGNGQTVTIPIAMQLDLYQFFGNRGADDLINLALAIGGAQGSSSRLKMTARVTAEVPPLAPFEYPGDLTIIDKGFSNP
jgi:hypothetical protein